LNPRPTD